MAEIRPAVALGDVQFIGMWYALTVKPGFVIESDGVDDKGVTVPFGNRIAHPQRLEVFRMTATIQKELTIAMDVSLIKNDDQRGRLNELLRKWRNPRDTGRQTMPFRIILAQIRPALLI